MAEKRRKADMLFQSAKEMRESGFIELTKYNNLHPDKTHFEWMRDFNRDAFQRYCLHLKQLKKRDKEEYNKHLCCIGLDGKKFITCGNCGAIGHNRTGCEEANTRYSQKPLKGFK